MGRVAGWGNVPQVEAPLRRARGTAPVLAAIADEPSLIARGNGRAYGDAALNDSAMLSLLPSDRVLAFDRRQGTITCETGLLLGDLIALTLPAGWLPPVLPGTRFVTVGGMIAADVHGKNHHNAGCFGAWLDSLTLALADGRVLTCSASENADLFEASQGGMGLTGVILCASFRLMRVPGRLIRRRLCRSGSLDETLQLFETHGDWRYAVAWIDGLAPKRQLGRALLSFAEHAEGEPAAAPRRRIALPVFLPAGLVNGVTVRAFNALYYRAGQNGDSQLDLERYFFPLDAVAGWNRLYGRRGFLQYQCVLPLAASRDGLTALLRQIAAAGLGSFLAVLKLMGPMGRGWLSFPLHGYTLALDFPASPASRALIARLDAITGDYGGRVYLAKDACSTATLLRHYPGLERFRALRRQIDPGGKFASLQSVRLGL